MKNIHILYIDPEIKTAGQIVSYFNPRVYSDEINEYFQDKKEAVKYQFIFIHKKDFKEGFNTLKAHNADPVASQRGLPPIDFIIFTLPKTYNRVKVNQKHSYLDFLEKIHFLGIDRLGLWRGFWAIGYQFTETLWRELSWYGVRNFLTKPIIIQDLENQLNQYMELTEPSPNAALETRPPKTLKSGKIVTQRFLRLKSSDGKPIHMALPSIIQANDVKGQAVWQYSYQTEGSQEELESDENFVHQDIEGSYSEIR
ncbi:hypothetical protein C7H19_22300 [Aphanothece hegewaldii CCALA 016]|uniref:Uncharacterized protein n=1 Tax=Aphanothece hegewaldii CCALA 016 TaxID=2107694 RepID=A0A2T1LRV0_9CHRO|nr:hypothetical protein [Aphanothece hegewaldii]PSF31759.1 hypothetical protein C7H19_22300 [Aphanothece hegewaldii CCALA 016]